MVSTAEAAEATEAVFVQAMTVLLRGALRRSPPGGVPRCAVTAAVSTNVAGMELKRKAQAPEATTAGAEGEARGGQWWWWDLVDARAFANRRKVATTEEY